MQKNRRDVKQKCHRLCMCWLAALKHLLSAKYGPSVYDIVLALASDIACIKVSCLLFEQKLPRTRLKRITIANTGIKVTRTAIGKRAFTIMINTLFCSVVLKVDNISDETPILKLEAPISPTMRYIIIHTAIG